MKICPRCSKTYTDENLNFCLDDGSVLNQMGGGAMPETVMMNQPRPTDPTPSNPFTTAQPTQQPPPPAWNVAPQAQAGGPPKKSSKMWLWVVLILGLGVLLCGGGAVAVAIFSSMNDGGNSTVTDKSPTPGKGTPAKTSSPSNSSSTTTTSTDSSRDDIDKVDLSEWVRPFSAFGSTEMSGSDLIMSSKQKGYYYVICAPADTLQTEKADTLLTVRNVDNMDSRLGYGLVFHSNPTPLQQGYAFLINSKTGKYRIVRHSPGKEDTVTTWTKSTAIKTGSEDNRLEVRDLEDKMEFYINGTMVTSTKNTHGYSGGVVGLYSGDAAKIAFKDLELRK